MASPEHKPTLIAIFAHPDDETCLAGGTLAACAAAGIRVALICATRGEAADLCCLPEPVDPPELARIREAELRCAADALGLDKVFVMGLPDNGLANLKLMILTAGLLDHFPSRAPAVVMTFDPDDVSEHPDHRAIGRAATAAAQAVGAALLYVVSGETREADETHLGVNIGPWAEHKRQAMRCHRSQAGCWRDLEAALARGEGVVEVFRLAGPLLPVSLTWLFTNEVTVVEKS